MKELEQAEAEVAEIEDCDQDYLKELKVFVAERKFVLHFCTGTVGVELKQKLSEPNCQMANLS